MSKFTSIFTVAVGVINHPIKAANFLFNDVEEMASDIIFEVEKAEEFKDEVSHQVSLYAHIAPNGKYCLREQTGFVFGYGHDDGVSGYKPFGLLSRFADIANGFKDYVHDLSLIHI